MNLDSSRGESGTSGTKSGDVAEGLACPHNRRLAANTGWVCRDCGYKGNWPLTNEFSEVIAAVARGLVALSKTMILTCEDCGATWSVSEAEHADLVARNQVTQKLVQGRAEAWDGTMQPTSTTVSLSICTACQKLFWAAGRKRQPRVSVEQETAGIRELMALIRERRNDLTTEQIAHAAVEQWNSPSSEPDAAFAAWLRQREGL